MTACQDLSGGISQNFRYSYDPRVCEEIRQRKSELYRMTQKTFLALLIVGAAALAAGAGPARVPVLGQIDLPHNYYFRELYLPQLTTGPSSVAWTPDGTTLIYSMQGSLWRQRADATTAEQLTGDGGSDYQPDCAPDGRSVAFVRYG